MPPIPQQLFEQLQRKYEIPYLQVKNVVGWMGSQPIVGGSTPTPGGELSLTTLTIQQLYDLSIDQLSQIGV